MCRKRGDSVPREIERYEDGWLVELGVPQQAANGGWYAPILRQIDVEEFHGLGAGEASALADLDALAARDLPPTKARRLVDARLGQGRYRRDLLERWSHRCAVTGCGVLPAIRASHVKPWRLSSDRERLDPQNGLPLLATLDALFDAGLIAFEGTGEMRVSTQLNAGQRTELDLPRRLREAPSAKLIAYLSVHRERVFRP